MFPPNTVATLRAEAAISVSPYENPVVLYATSPRMLFTRESCV